MTTVDAMADEIMKGLTEYADLADTAMKKAVRKSATQVKNEISANAPEGHLKICKKLGNEEDWRKQSLFGDDCPQQESLPAGTPFGKGTRQAWRWTCIRQTTHCSCGRKWCTTF